MEYQGHNFYRPWFTRYDPSVRDFIYKGDSGKWTVRKGADFVEFIQDLT